MSNTLLEIPTAESDLPKQLRSYTDLLEQGDSGVQSFRDGMACLGASVNVVTAMVDGGPVGFTATAVTSVTDSPPTLLVCLNRQSSVFEAFEKTDSLCVNTLAAAQEDVSGVFAGKKSQPERFEQVHWHSFISGAPILDASAVAFDCRISSRVTVGTHDVLFCQVIGVSSTSSKSNLVYFNRGYHNLA
jgi:flavin reductase